MMASSIRDARGRQFLVGAALCTVWWCATAAAQPDSLPSWNDGAAKQAIIDFVSAATKPGTPSFIAPDERIAVFDNDGTLWSEKPMYVQLAFALDRVKALAPAHPEWKQNEPFKSILAGNLKFALERGPSAVDALVLATHAGMSTAEFEATVRKWIASAEHPLLKRPYPQLVYQPMLELLTYLRANGFKTYIVSGGGVEFMRPWTEEAYGIPPEQVIGSTIVTNFELRDGKPVLMRAAKVEFVDDGPGKPVAINKFIGRRPVFAFGNSDGDLQMLQWTTAGEGPRFAGIVHHTDAKREVAYDRQSLVGRLDKALTEAGPNGWTVVDMAKDWKTVFPDSRPAATAGRR
jgi:phosphoserine phosphatase